MSVGLVVPGFSADEADWCIPALRHLARQLAIEGEDVRVIAVRYPYRAARYTVDGVEVVSIGGARQRGPATLDVWRRTFDLLRSEHRRRPFSVLHAFWATESGFLSALVGRALHVPTLVSLAGGELASLPDIGYGDQRIAWERFKIAISLRLASGVSVGSKWLFELAIRHVPPRRVSRLPLGVDLDLFAPAELSTPSSSKRVLHVGALTPVKDQAVLLRAFALLRQQLPCATLDVVGDGPLEPGLRHLASELVVADAVRWHGDVDHAHLPRLYQSANAFVLTSRHEAQGMVVLEAAACGTPVVGTHVGVLPELGPTVAVGDAEGLMRGLGRALRGGRPSAEAGRRLVEAEFSLARSTQRFQAAYAALRRAHRRAASA